MNGTEFEKTLAPRRRRGILQPFRHTLRMRRAGFTLIEMLLTVVIMTIFTGAVVVSLRGRQEPARLRLTGEDVMQTLRCAIQKARGSGLEHRVVYDQTANSLRVEVMDMKTAEFVPAAGLPGKGHRLAGHVRIDAIEKDAVESPDDLLFEPSGGGFTGRVIVVDERGETVVIAVLAGSGEVYVLDE